MGRLKNDIMIKKLATFTKAMALVTRLIDMDEDRMVRQDDDKTSAKNNDKFKFRRSRPQRSFLRGSTGSQSAGFRKEIDKQNYTPLNAPRSKVLMWIRANGVGIPRLERIDSAKRERADTDEYRELQKAIEQLIQNGKLENFINRRYRDSKD